MDPRPEPTVVAARAATLMAYVVAVVGAGAATLSLRAGETIPAVLVLTTTLGVAALLAATGTLLRGLRDVERRLRRIEDDLGSASR
jgi:NAD/NADP transhydrogenase alpha subunit